jgi:phosphatidylinositol kinase/protein kinase (PI-3  family)
MTISSLKKYGDRSLRKIYQEIYGDHWDLASTNFMNSLAGYSLICYIFQIKDRHNGNILIDSEGHIIHIDFSFILSKCPGNIGFEKAPFKLTEDYIDLMGGLNSDMFKQFKELLILGLTYIRKYAIDIVKYI